VTHFLKDAFLGQNEFIPTSDNPDGTIEPDITALMESFSGDLRESNNDGFAVIYKVRILLKKFFLIGSVNLG